jgi:hypothetical protein
MSFSCPNYDSEKGECIELECRCVPGRPGCVLENRVHLSDEARELIESESGGSADRITQNETNQI